MRFDNSLTALIRPSRASDYFDFPQQPRIDPTRADFCRPTALWLAELCRLIYRQEADEIGRRARGPRRGEVLQRVRLREEAFFTRGGTQCSIVVSDDPLEAPFAVVVFRGTHDLLDWRTNLTFSTTESAVGGRVHRGFEKALLRVWDPVEEILAAVMPPERGPRFYAGHSLGAALATLAAARLAPRATYAFGGPEVGDRAFAAAVREAALHRVVNNRDVVPRLFWPLRRRKLVHAGRPCFIAPDSTLWNEPKAAPDARRHPDDQRRLLDPPRCLADHSIANYIAHLERAPREG